MLKLVATSQFRKDYKRIKKQGKNLSLLKNIINQLIAEQTLPPENRDHSLSGKHTGYRECHIQSDWLLIYKQDKDNLILTVSRTGSHAELLKM